MTNKEVKKLLAICEKRNEINFLYSITKDIAESDSIAEGYGYNPKGYPRKWFNEEIKHIKSNSNQGHMYIRQASIKIYKSYLKKIGVL